VGRIITFYSFKGGVGRSMALANVAVLLANWGYKVLAVDFDLEAPGSENFFARSVETDDARDARGVNRSALRGCVDRSDP
jgi:MinD-like ATPase involved in chromosome partitioning or flagellar assembly